MYASSELTQNTLNVLSTYDILLNTHVGNVMSRSVYQQFTVDSLTRSLGKHVLVVLSRSVTQVSTFLHY